MSGTLWTFDWSLDRGSSVTWILIRWHRIKRAGRILWGFPRIRGLEVFFKLHCCNNHTGKSGNRSTDSLLLSPEILSQGIRPGYLPKLFCFLNLMMIPTNTSRFASTCMQYFKWTRDLYTGFSSMLEEHFKQSDCLVLWGWGLKSSNTVGLRLYEVGLSCLIYYCVPVPIVPTIPNRSNLLILFYCEIIKPI